MKKIIISLFCIILIGYMLYIPQVKAENATANVTFNGTLTEDTVELTINVGDFEGFEPGEVVNAEMTLDFNDSAVTSVEAESAENWKVDLIESTKRLLISTDNSTENTQIAKITFHLNTGNYAPTDPQTLSINDFNIANGSILNETYKTYSYTYTPGNSSSGGGSGGDVNDDNGGANQGNNETNSVGENETQNETGNTNNTGNTTNSIRGNNTTDTTVAQTKLPSAGASTIVMITIIVIIVLAIIFKFKSRKIKY